MRNFAVTTMTPFLYRASQVIVNFSSFFVQMRNRNQIEEDVTMRLLQVRQHLETDVDQGLASLDALGMNLIKIFSLIYFLFERRFCAVFASVSLSMLACVFCGIISPQQSVPLNE